MVGRSAEGESRLHVSRAVFGEPGAPRYPRSWAELDLPPELDSPEKRLGAAVNIIQNGAQSLTVLAMNPQPGYWESYNQINKRLPRIGGGNLVYRTVTRNHLVQTIEPVGAAARSTLDNKEWTITPFGVALRPAILLAWQNFLDLDLDAMQVLGSNSRVKKDNEGNIVSTPAQARTRILLDLLEKGHLRIIDLSSAIGLSTAVTNKHADGLSHGGIVEKDVASSEANESITHYTLTKQGRDQEKWPIFVLKHKTGSTAYVSLSREVELAVRELSENGIPFSIRNCIEVFNKHRPENSKGVAETTVFGMLAFWGREGLMDVGKFHNRFLSDVVLTPLGELVASEILQPLQDWSNNPRSVILINEILEDLRRGSDYQSLKIRIAESFSNTSPFKNKDIDLAVGKGTVLRMIRERPGELTQASIARTLNISPMKAHRVIGALLATGEIAEEKAVSGQRRFLRPVKK